MFLSLKEQRILILLWAQYCKILAGALIRQITKRLLLVLMFTRGELCGDAHTPDFLGRNSFNMRIRWRAGSAYPP